VLLIPLLLAQVMTLTQGQAFREDVVGVILTTLEQWGEQQGASQDLEQQQGGEEQQEGQEEEEEEVDPQLSQALQQLAYMSMMPSEPHVADDTDSSDPPGQDAAAAGAGGAAAEGQAREYQQLMEGLGRVIKAAVTGPSCGAAAWGALGRWYLLQGEVRSAQEAALKEVRGLGWGMDVWGGRREGSRAGGHGAGWGGGHGRCATHI
jgi:hypothetical protein